MSMMNRHNRKSHQGPAPPKSLKDSEKEKNKTSSPRPMPPPKPSSSSSSTTSSGKPTRPPLQQNPSSGEIQIANDVSPNPQSQSQQPQPPQLHSKYNIPSTRSALDHLSLETQEASRPTYSSHGTPASALDVPSRPQMGARSASSSNMRSKAAFNTTLPIRAAPAPGVGPGQTHGHGHGHGHGPAANGSGWRRQVRDHMAAYGS